MCRVAQLELGIGHTHLAADAQIALGQLGGALTQLPKTIKRTLETTLVIGQVTQGRESQQVVARMAQGRIDFNGLIQDGLGLVQAPHHAQGLTHLAQAGPQC